MYQKLHREAKSGSEPVGRTSRQREIIRLCGFLRQHIKTSASLTSYKEARSPSKYEYQVKTPRKSTPKVAHDDRVRKMFFTYMLSVKAGSVLFKSNASHVL